MVPRETQPAPGGGVSRPNPWLARRVLNYAHRGGAREAPSSTIYAMRHALTHGADGLEMDVHATADGHLVCSHDATVDRTTNGSGAVAELSLAQLKALDPAWWFVPGKEAVMGLSEDAYPLRGRVATEPELEIPTLDEVLAAFPDVFLNLDIKATAPEVAPYEEALARALARFGRSDDVIVASFNDLATQAFSQFAPEVATSAGTMGVAQFWRAVRDGEDPPALGHAALQVPVEFSGQAIIDARFVAAAHGAGMAVHAWTVDDGAEVERLVGLGVDGIISDLPSVVTAALARLGAGYGR